MVLVKKVSCPNNENDKREDADVWMRLYTTPNKWDRSGLGRFPCAFPAHHYVTSIQGNSVTSISFWLAEP